MTVNDFLMQNLDDYAIREDVQKYISLKEYLSRNKCGGDKRPCEYFQEYLKMKGELFNEAMENYLTKRGEGGVMK